MKGFLLYLYDMKTLLTFLFLIFSFQQDKVVYRIEYVNQLNQSQIVTIANRMIVNFPSNCRPSSLSVNSTTAYVSFGSTCMSGEDLKNVSLRTVPDAPVRKIFIGNRVIWPIPLK